MCLRIKESLSLVLHKSEYAAIPECTRGFNNRNTLCTPFWLCLVCEMRDTPVRSIQITPEKHLLQFQANVLH